MRWVRVTERIIRFGESRKATKFFCTGPRMPSSVRHPQPPRLGHDGGVIQLTAQPLTADALGSIGELILPIARQPRVNECLGAVEAQDWYSPLADTRLNRGS